MKLYINNEEIAFSLEDEKNLYEIITSIDKQLAESGGFISSVSVNNEIVSIDESTLKAIDINSANVLHIEAHSKDEQSIENIQTTIKYLQVLISFITKLKDSTSSDDTIQADLEKANIHFDDLHNIADNIDFLFFGYTPPHFPMKHMFLHACTSSGFLQNDDVLLNYSEQAIKIFTMLSNSLEQRIVRILKPQEYAKEINNNILQQLPEVQKIPELLSTGDETLAIHYFVSSIDLISMWMQALADAKYINCEAISDEEWTQKHKDFSFSLQEFLLEMSEALEARDWVTVNDILEYEVIPKIQVHAELAQEYFLST